MVKNNDVFLVYFMVLRRNCKSKNSWEKFLTEKIEKKSCLMCYLILKKKRGTYKRETKMNLWIVNKPYIKTIK